MVEVPLKIRYNGGEAEAGFNRLQSKGVSVAGAIKTAFAGIAVGAFVNEFKKSFMEFEKGEAGLYKLRKEMERIGGSAKLYEDAVRRIGSATSRFGIEDDQLSEAMASLVRRSGDAEASMANMQLVMDISAKTGKDFGSVTDLVSKAMLGQFKAAASLEPSLKNIARAHKELEGTAEGAQLMLDKLNDSFGGGAKDKAETAVGQIERAKTIFGEMKEEGIRILAGSNSTKDAWTDIADAMERGLNALKKVEGAPIIQSAIGLLTGTQNKVQVGGMDMNRDQLDAYNKTFGRSLGYRYPDVVVHPGDNEDQSSPKPSGNIPPPKGGKGGKTPGRTKQWWEDNTFRGWNTNEIAPKEYQNFDLGESMKALDEEQKKQEEALQATRDKLVSNMMSAFDAIRGGWKSTIDWMAKYALEKLIFTTLANALIPSSGSAVSGITETTGVFPTQQKSFGAGGARQRAAELRNARG
jgi:hypothetical protein